MKLLLEGLDNKHTKPQLIDILWKATEGRYERFIMRVRRETANTCRKNEQVFLFKTPKKLN